MDYILSIKNDRVKFDYTYGGPLCAQGKGHVTVADLRPLARRDDLDWHWVSFTAGITSIGRGVLELFKDIEVLSLSYTVEDIEVTEELINHLKQNNVLIKGWKQSLGERFAKEHSLQFAQDDILVGWNRFEMYGHSTNTKLTLRFRPDNSAYLKFDDYTSGISAGNNGGGEYTRDLPAGFPHGETLESFAQRLERFREVIMKNEELKRFFKNNS